MLHVQSFPNDSQLCWDFTRNSLLGSYSHFLRESKHSWSFILIARCYSLSLEISTPWGTRWVYHHGDGRQRPPSSLHGDFCEGQDREPRPPARWPTAQTALIILWVVQVCRASQEEFNIFVNALILYSCRELHEKKLHLLRSHCQLTRLVWHEDGKCSAFNPQWNSLVSVCVESTRCNKALTLVKRCW